MDQIAISLSMLLLALYSIVHGSRDAAVSPTSFPSSNVHDHRRHKMLVAAPPKDRFIHLAPTNHLSTEGPSPVIPPMPLRTMQSPDTHVHAHGPVPEPEQSIEFHKNHVGKRSRSPSSAPSHLFPPPFYHKGAVASPASSYPPTVLHKKTRHKPHHSLPSKKGPPPSVSIEGPMHSPTISPSGTFTRKQRKPVRSPFQVFPSSPPNQDCSSVPCTEPLTNTLPGMPCGCVWPMQIGLRLRVSLYNFFPLVSEFSQEIAAGILMNQSQVRIIGANADSQEPGVTVVLINLVPLGYEFNNGTVFIAYEKFWHKKVLIKASLFGDYRVLYVNYPGLPPSPPSVLTNITIDDGLSPSDLKPRMNKPVGVNIKEPKNRLDAGLIAAITLSSVIVLILCVGAVWLLLWKCRDHTHPPSSSPRTLLPLGKPSAAGPGSIIFGSGPSSASLSFGSSIATYAGSAKTFSLSEIQKATDNFDPSRILGEGGFGLVYRGDLEDGKKVAVKVLKRYDHQGGREFLAEVEMLSRLHHRNLVKLIGICTEEHSRCLVYELIPNGSVESHLHGVDKKTSPLDWNARMKIALGSARGLAYLHEDSNPRVIHRDFKSSNILLEFDFTPKVSDFGLARSALDGCSEHISTRVMGTFGYVAPEYAMTGHLLVKSDVYSYGVVLLELLTGRRPVDMSQPPGQENLVTWARPLLTTKEGLEAIIDPALGFDFLFDSVAKVAAIASMCVQPEVSHRPFMGEVVQALKLVYNECDEKEGCSVSSNQDDLETQHTEGRVGAGSSQLPETFSFLDADYDSGLEAERALSTSDIFNTSMRFERQESRSFRRHSSSGPLRTNRVEQYWLRGPPSGSVNEHGGVPKSWPGVAKRERWL